MSKLTSQRAPDILSVCLSNASKAADALSRAFDVQVALEPAGAHALSFEEPPPSLAGPALALAWQTPEGGVLALINEGEGILPRWYSEPDVPGAAKLATLAQELGLLLLPESLSPTTFSAKHVVNAIESLRGGVIGDDIGHIEFIAQSGHHRASLHLVWPVASIEGVFAPQGPPPGIPPGRVPLSAARSSGAYDRSEAAARRGRNLGLDALPQYSRSLLKVRLPVRVVLARQRQRVENVVDLAPGAILQFDKPCDDLLELEVGGQSVAEGEAVKVGDKFGFRVSSILLPSERFRKV